MGFVELLNLFGSDVGNIFSDTEGRLRDEVISVTGIVNGFNSGFLLISLVI